MDPLLLRVLVVIAIAAFVIAVGAWWRARDGRVEGSDGTRIDSAQLAELGLHLDVGQKGGVLIGSPTCTPCDTVKDLLTTLEAERPQLVWTYVDAGDHLAFTQELGILRVPTLLLVDADGQLVARTSGVPELDALRRVLDDDAVPDDVAV